MRKLYLVLFLITLVLLILVIIYVITGIICDFFVNSVNPIDVTDEQADIYFKLLYGKDTPSQTRVNFLSLDILYEDILKKAGIKYESIGSTCCPTKNYHIFKWMGCCYGSFDPKDTVWIYHKPPYKAVTSNTWIEVTHCLGVRVSVNEQVGAWYYVARGSNTFVNTGVTIAFVDHIDAVKYFLNIDCEDIREECNQYFTRFIEVARNNGYDTIQFLGHTDMRCGNTGVEIIELAQKGAQVIPTPFKFKTGFNHDKICNPVKRGNCISC
jgi:hypothetical protein